MDATPMERLSEPGLRPMEVFPPETLPSDSWKPLYKAVRANSLLELERRVEGMSYSEDACSMHFPLKVVPDQNEDELPCTEWFAYKPSGPGQRNQTESFMPLLFAAVHNVYRWGAGFRGPGASDPPGSPGGHSIALTPASHVGPHSREPTGDGPNTTGSRADAEVAAAQCAMALDILDFTLRHGGDPMASSFLGLEVTVTDITIKREPERDSPVPGGAGRARWLEETRDDFNRFFNTRRLSPLRRNIRVTGGEYEGRELFEAYGDLNVNDTLAWDTSLHSGVVVTVSAKVTDWHFAPVVACDIESKENYLYVPIGGCRAALDYSLMLKEYAGRAKWPRVCAAMDEVLRRFYAWTGRQRTPQMASVPAAMAKLFDDLYRDSSTADVVLEAADGRELPAHRLVLSAGSPYFRALLNGPFLEGHSRRVSIACDFEVLHGVVRFIYCGREEGLIGTDPLRVLPVAHQYGLDHLQHACEVNAKNMLDITRIGRSIRAGHVHGSHRILKAACFAYISKNPVRCMLRPEVNCLKEEEPELWNEIVQHLGVVDETVASNAKQGASPKPIGEDAANPNLNPNASPFLISDSSPTTAMSQSFEAITASAGEAGAAAAAANPAASAAASTSSNAKRDGADGNTPHAKRGAEVLAAGAADPNPSLNPGPTPAPAAAACGPAEATSPDSNPNETLPGEPARKRARTEGSGGGGGGGGGGRASECVIC